MEPAVISLIGVALSAAGVIVRALARRRRRVAGQAGEGFRYAAEADGAQVQLQPIVRRALDRSTAIDDALSAAVGLQLGPVPGHDQAPLLDLGREARDELAQQLDQNLLDALAANRKTLREELRQEGKRALTISFLQNAFFYALGVGTTLLISG